MINRFITTITPLLPISFIRMIAGRYVAGESTQEALKVVKELNEKGFSVTLDISGEHSTKYSDAQFVTQKYADLYINL